MYIEKSEKIKNVRYELRGRISDMADALIAQGNDVIRLNIGNPGAFGFKTTSAVEQSLAAHAADAVPYSHTKGLAHVREAIADYHRKLGLHNVSEDDIYTGNGVSELIQITLQALLNHGDEVLVPTPDYPLWTAATILAGGSAVHYLCDEQAGWCPSIEDMRAKITEKTRAIVVINPNNPTGAVYTKNVLEQIAQLAREHNLVLLADEIYDRLLFDDAVHIPLGSLAPDLFCVTFNGISKSHQVCGYRGGWMVISGDKNGTQDYMAGVNTLASLRLCSNVTGQFAILAALHDLETPNVNLRPGGRLYEQRELVHRELNSIPGLSAVKSAGALYMFPKIDATRFNITSDEQFVLDFLREKHVYLTQGTGFNWKTPDHFRLVFLPPVDQLTEVMNRLRDFLATYRQN